MASQPLDETVAQIQSRFEETNSIRDSALNASRQAVRHCAAAIRAIHRDEIAGAETELALAQSLLDRVAGETKDEGQIFWAGYVQDATKEIAEARILLAIVRGESIPSPADIAVEDAAYLNGLAEAASELRRLILHTLRGDDIDLAGRYLAAMNDIYDLLITVDFPDAITGGLRRTTDQLRGVLERTRGDYTLTVNQRRLENAISAFRKDLGPRGS